MKIMTWNVNGIRSCVQKGLFEAIAQYQPDIFCLQETKAHPDQLEKELVARDGWRCYWSSASRKGYSGTVTFTKIEPVTVEHGIGVPKFDAEGRFVVTAFDDFVLFNVYFPNGGSGPERHRFKMEFLKRFTVHLKKRLAAGRNVILVGDYNVAPLEIDVYDPIKLAAESGFLPEEREWFQEFLKTGFVDGFRHLHPEATNRFTWWSYKEKARIGNRGWRIDHICLSTSLKSRIKSVEILDQVEGSDHCPVLIEI